jgi:hypothetical protein
LVPQLLFALQLLLDEQLPFVPHDALSECAPAGHLHSFLGADAHPVMSPAMAAAMMNALASIVIRLPLIGHAWPST